MKLSDLSKNLFFLLIFIFVFKTSYAEQEVDIWDNKNKKNANEITTTVQQQGELRKVTKEQNGVEINYYE